MVSKKVLLIYPPNQLMDIETPRPDGSLGPLYLASALESKGIQTDILDASVGAKQHYLKNTFYRSIRQDNGLIRIGMNFDEIAEYVSKGNYGIAGISSNFTPQTRMTFETAKAIKNADPKIKIYAGGVNARALKERFLKTGLFDGICITEGDLVFQKMAEAGLTGKSLEGIAGTAYIADNKIKINHADSSCFPKSLDDIPMPAWEKLPFEKYEKIASPHGVDVTEHGKNRYAPIMTSRGCPFKCTYCHISKEKDEAGETGVIGNLRLHSIERVIHEIDRLKSLGVEKLFFEDDSLLAKKTRVKEIFKVLKDKNLSLADVNGVNLVHLYRQSPKNQQDILYIGKLSPNDRFNDKLEVDEEYLHILKEGGFEQIVFPVESASPRILKKYASNKILPEKMNLFELMKKMTNAGIKAPVNMMIGFPDETEEEMQMSIDFSKRLMDAGAPYVTFFIPIPFPGSELYDIAIKGGHLDPDFNPDLMNWKRPVMKNTTVSPERLVEIRDKAHETVNTKEYIEKRIKQSAGHRLAD